METVDYPAATTPGFIHRLFLSRIIGTPLAFLCLAPALYQNDLSVLTWLVCIVATVLWPYLARYVGVRSTGPGRAEKVMQLFDSLVAGGAIAFIHFNVLPTVTLLGALCLSNLSFGGPGMLLRGLVAVVVGEAVVGAVFGYTSVIETTRLTVYGCAPMIIIYPSVIGLFSYQLQRELEAQRERWQQLSRVDGLTGLLNRRAWEQAVAAEFQRYQRHHAPAAVIMLDIDHFKRVNDRYGHGAGDAVLCRIGECITEELRGSDSGGRYGGEEFGVLLPDTDERQAMVLAERLRRSIGAVVVETDVGEKISCSVSLGIAALDKTMAGYSQWVDAADQALYLAKRAGRNRSYGFRGASLAGEREPG